MWTPKNKMGPNRPGSSKLYCIPYIYEKQHNGIFWVFGYVKQKLPVSTIKH